MSPSWHAPLRASSGLAARLRDALAMATYQVK
jgi:hypothetical protein